jgi:phosphoribosylglycinamide formyltransferase-1
MIRLGILGSTRGSNLDAIVSAIVNQTLKAHIEVVFSNKPTALILERAAAFGLQTVCMEVGSATREEYDDQLTRELKQYDIDLIVLIGYMRILSAKFIANWPQKIINVHPSLLPAYRGLMDLAVHRAVLEAQDKETGCTVHYVTEEVDGGPIILQKRCPVIPIDTPETLKQRVQKLEGEALVEAIRSISPL